MRAVGMSSLKNKARERGESLTMYTLCQQADPAACLNVVSSLLAIVVSLLAIVPWVVTFIAGLFDAVAELIRAIRRDYLLLLIVAAVVAICVGLAIRAGLMDVGDPSSTTFHISSSNYYRVHYEFTSVKDGGKWPGSGQVYFINRGEQRKHKLRCDRPGEKVCYGAWIAGDTSTYWGKGYGGQYGCTDCCAFCGGQDVHLGIR